jgi:DNA modification methylase
MSRLTFLEILIMDKYDKVIGSAFELAWSKKKRKREILRHEYSSWGARMEGATENGKPHPTMKPVAMLSDVINKTESKNIVDLFLGSGSTMVAAHQLNANAMVWNLTRSIAK